MTYDVVIVGAGPAGASTALHLVRRWRMDPRRILVLDKARFPRDKPCAGAISQLGLDVLADVGVRVRVPQVAMRGVRVLEGDEHGATAMPMGICVRRTELDAALVDEVRADGVDVRDGEGIRSLERAGGSFRVGTTGGRIVHARFIAAADGAGSTTRKLCAIPEAARKGHLYVLDTPAVPADAGGPARELVDFDLSVLADGVDGYYWDFPTVIDGRAAVCRGIYHANFVRPDMPDGRSLKDVLGRALARRGIDLATVKLRPFSTRPFVPASPTWAPGVVLVGEACGIDRTTGEGIAQALDMGRMAARHLAWACASGDDRFDGYANEVCASITGRHLLQSAWLAPRVLGRRGGPARRYLLRSAFARTAAVRWYRGERLERATIARLGLGLGARAFSPRRRS